MFQYSKKNGSEKKWTIILFFLSHWLSADKHKSQTIFLEPFRQNKSTERSFHTSLFCSAHLSPHFIVVVDIIIWILHPTRDPLHIWQRAAGKYCFNMEISSLPSLLCEWLQQLRTAETLQQVWPILSQESLILDPHCPAKTYTMAAFASQLVKLFLFSFDALSIQVTILLFSFLDFRLNAIS